jgi:hypothetical protein
MFGEAAIAGRTAMNTIQIAIAPSGRPEIGSISRARLVSPTHSFFANRRGAVSFEMTIVFGLLILGLLLPLADFAIAGFQFLSARGALRGFGQSIQYDPPADVTNASSWATSAMAKADPAFPIQNLQVLCNTSTSNAVCSAANVSAPVKYFSYTTSVTLAPLVLTRVLCNSGAANPCTFTMPYSERFQ